MKAYALAILGLLVLAGCAAPDQLGEEPPIDDTLPPQETTPTTGAQSGDLVVVEYVGTLADGSVVSQEQSLEFILGQGQLIPAFEAQITGMQVGEEKTFTLTAAEAYGERVEQTQEVPLEEFGDQTPQEGMLISIIDPQTQQEVVGQIIAVGEQTVTIDLNHPLAGEDLTFAVEVVDVAEAPPMPEFDIVPTQ